MELSIANFFLNLNWKGAAISIFSSIIFANLQIERSLCREGCLMKYFFFFMYSGFILLSVLNSSRARFLGRFILLLLIYQIYLRFAITRGVVSKYSKSSFLYFFYLILVILREESYVKIVITIYLTKFFFLEIHKLLYFLNGINWLLVFFALCGKLFLTRKLAVDFNSKKLQTIFRVNYFLVYI